MEVEQKKGRCNTIKRAETQLQCQQCQKKCGQVKVWQNGVCVLMSHICCINTEVLYVTANL